MVSPEAAETSRVSTRPTEGGVPACSMCWTWPGHTATLGDDRSLAAEGVAPASEIIERQRPGTGDDLLGR